VIFHRPSGTFRSVSLYRPFVLETRRVMRLWPLRVSVTVSEVPVTPTVPVIVTVRPLTTRGSIESAVGVFATGVVVVGVVFAVPDPVVVVLVFVGAVYGNVADASGPDLPAASVRRTLTVQPAAPAVWLLLDAAGPLVGGPQLPSGAQSRHVDSVLATGPLPAAGGCQLTRLLFTPRLVTVSCGAGGGVPSTCRVTGAVRVSLPAASTTASCS